MSNAKKLLSEIRLKRKELKKIQLKCKHKNKQIKMDSRNQAMFECDECEARFGYPSYTELQKWLRK